MHKLTDALEWLFNVLYWLFGNLWSAFMGLLLYTFTYLVDIKGEIHIMFFAFAFDLVLGVITSMTIDKERFSMEKFFIAIVRLLITIILIALLYSLDREMEQTAVCVNKVIAYMATAAWIISAADNGYKLTKWKPFLQVKSLVIKATTKTILTESKTETTTKTETTQR